MRIYDRFISYCVKRNKHLTKTQMEIAEHLMSREDLFNKLSSFGGGKTFLFDTIEDFVHDNNFHGVVEENPYLIKDSTDPQS